ncbi:polysaccharide deacetylase family protein [Paenibacillus xerothermodurans]|uniref:Polysaccharide deacetylase family protein n=1 Tax=Paenibacillus xerothermodurans TaxID=1977292 RepID=A0A2W1NSD0_PAEXE|nr:polysaccharide deacetylase family protein [Paenibacillus xerothermodurans]PZE20656.1 polysaccharide deacetylase family protein [Paenibacillus xerothermodurans]
MWANPIIITALLAALFTVDSTAPQYKNRQYYEARGDIVWEVPTQEQIIALTFDDGPDPADTPAILDLLKQYEAKATFFVIGTRVEAYPELAKREIADGHEIANHSYHHRYFTRRIGGDRVYEDISQAERVIVDTTGRKPSLFRPPGGFYGDNVVDAAKRSGYQVIMWSWHQNTRDWDTPGVKKIVDTVLNNAHNGDIILFHDYVEGQTQTVDALKQVLPELKNRGFRFVTVSELLTFRKTADGKH